MKIVLIMEQPYHRGIHYFAILTAIVAVFLIIVGATVTSTGSGDAVPDWPLSYGSLTPPMKGGIFYEHSHRIIAGITGIFIFILAVWLLLKESRKVVRWLGVIAVVAVLIQAILGGLRVLLVSTESVQDFAINMIGASVEPVRIAIAVSHAFLAQTVVCLIFAIAVLTSRSWLRFKSPVPDEKINRKFAGVAILLALVFLQLILGAVVRHTGAGLIIPDFPLSFGKIIPPFGNLPNDPNAPFPISDAAFIFKTAVHFLHRLIGFTILIWSIVLFSKRQPNVKMDIFFKFLLYLVVVQVMLGALNIWTQKAVWSTVSHVVVGALILVGTFIAVLWLGRLRYGAKATIRLSSGKSSEKSRVVFK